MIKAAAVPIDQVDDIWPQVAPLICKALEHDPLGQTIEEAYQRVMAGEYLLVLMLGQRLRLLAALTLELYTVNRDTVCNIVTAGGTDLNEWCNDFLDAAEVLAKEQGASKLTINGRPGWARRLKGRGFQPVLTVLEKSL